MEKFIKALKKFYTVFTVCVVCVGIAGAVFTVRYYKEQKARRTALMPPPAVVTGIGTETVKNNNEEVGEDLQNDTVTNSVISEEKEEQPETVEEKEVMAIPVTDDFKISMPVGGKLLNDFSGDELVYSKTFDDYRTHNGIDISAKRSEAVVSVADGVVENVYTDFLDGIVIVINHKNGYRSIYKNLSTDKMVKKGETVTEGQAISGVGETAVFEAAEPSHIHLELLKESEFVNPIKFLK
ncbi:MAG: M23 family metallopeptidase [Ruminococcaceae bacterium]|nr:M23 family metallopeptidase [Oscillospiraceae bacterium]